MDATTVGEHRATATDRETTMQAIVQDTYGGPDVLERRTSAGRCPGDDEVLIRCGRPASTGATGMS